MDNLRIGIFELFSSILPGIPYVLCFHLIYDLNHGVVSWDYIELEQIALMNLFIYGIISYLIGFAMQYVSYELFKYVLKSTKSFWKKRLRGQPISIGKRGKELSSIRHNSPENFKILNSFLAYRIMCYNMSFSLFVFVLALLINSINFCCFNWFLFILILSAVILMILFFRRAVSYHEWIHGIISDTEKLIREKVL